MASPATIENLGETQEQAATPVKGVISVDEWKMTPEFVRLTPRQKLLCLSWQQSGGDQVFAVKCAYDYASPESCQVLSYSMFGKNVRKALHVFLGMSEHEKLVEEVDRLLNKRTKTLAEVQTLRLRCELAGIVPDGLPADHGSTKSVPKVRLKKFKVGQTVYQDEKRYRVTSVNLAGQIVSAEEA